MGILIPHNRLNAVYLRLSHHIGNLGSDGFGFSDPLRYVEPLLIVRRRRIPSFVIFLEEYTLRKNDRIISRIEN